MKVIKSHEIYITALLFSVVMCFSFIAIKSAAAQTEVDTTVTNVTEEGDVADEASDDSNDLSDERAKMLEQIRSLRELVEQRRGQLQEQRQVRRDDRREEFQVNREEFMASLEGLSPEEKRAAMMEYVTQLREHIAEKQAEARTAVREIRETVQDNRNDFRSSLEGMTAEDRIAAIMERVAEIRRQIEDRVNTDLAEAEEQEPEQAEVVEDEEEDDDEDVIDVTEEEDEVQVGETEEVSDTERNFINEDLQVLRDCFFAQMSDRTAVDCTDADFDEDDVVNFTDLGEFRSALKYDLSGDDRVDMSDDGEDISFLQACFFSDAVNTCAPADLNDDGVVNASDLGSLKSAEKYDLNDDGVVDLRDDGGEDPKAN